MALQLAYIGAQDSLGIPPVPEALKMMAEPQESRLRSTIPTLSSSNANGLEATLRAFAFAHRGDWRGAAEAFGRVAKITPSSTTYFFLAHAHFKLEEYLRAANYFEKAVKLDANDLQALYSLGLTYYQLGKTDKALKAIRKVTQLDPDDPVYFFLLGYLQRCLQHWREAEEAYIKAIRLQTDFSGAYQYLALLYVELGRLKKAQQDEYFKKAVATFEELIKIYPKAADAYCNIGYVYEQLAERGKASEAYAQAVKVVSPDIVSLTELGTSLLNAKRYSEARQVFAKAVEKMEDRTTESDVTRKMVLTNYGVACMGEYASRQTQSEDDGLLHEAEDAFVAALALDPKYVHAQLNLGAVHYERGRVGQAIDEFERVLQIDPQNKPARDNLQALLEQQLDDRLLEQGLLKESRPPVTDFAPYKNRRLMRIRKKPLSEIVIEDRR